MSVVIEVTFPFGYVHATPWGTHVNEGAVEWPLSPWRLLRGLVATWYARRPDLDRDVVLRLLSGLAVPPAVRVDPRCEASIRAYLPDETYRSGTASPSTDLVIDAFAAVEPGTGLAYRWDVDLDADCRGALDALLTAIPYLGRAESICDAIARHDVADEEGEWLLPGGDAAGDGSRALAPTAPLDFDSLCESIPSMRGDGRLLPAGAGWIRYAVSSPIQPSTRTVRPTPRTDVHAVRLRLRAAAPISMRQSLAVADRVRAAAMAHYGRLAAGGTSETFVGRDEAGERLTGNQHAHWLPVDIDGDGLIDAVVVWAPGGLGSPEVASLGALRRLRFHGGDGLGSVKEAWVAIDAVGRRSAKIGTPAIFGGHDVWRSVTPFLPQRHQKGGRIEDHLVDCVGRELRARGKRTAFELTLDRETNWGLFRRQRSGKGRDVARPGFGMRLQFVEPVEGPICIGLMSHFGMGRFERVV